jgi:hypothetical protein
MAGQASNFALTGRRVWPGNRMALDRMIRGESFVEIDVFPAIDLPQLHGHAPRQSRRALGIIDLQARAHMASHTHVFRTSQGLIGIVAGVWGMAKNAISLRVGTMQNFVGGLVVTGEAQSVCRRN